MQNVTNEEYFYGSGDGAFIEIDPATGIATGRALYVGNNESVKVTMKVERKEKRESNSGTQALVRTKVVQLGGELSITVSESLRDNLELFLFGTTVTQASVTAHADSQKIPATAAAGNIFVLDRQKISNVQITDDGNTNAVVNPSKYEVDPVYGKIKALQSLGTGPFTVTYDAASVKVIPVFQHSGKTYLFRHEGVNTGNDLDLPYLFEAFKVQLDPVSDMELITDDFGKFEIKGTLLADPRRATDPNYGKFGRHVDLR